MPDPSPQEPSTLPRIAPGSAFVSWENLNGRPNAVVDARATHGTLLTLSHHPDAGSPAQLRADTSTAIVDRFLALPDAGREAVDVVLTNDHYDEDGVLGLWLLIEQPGQGDPTRSLACAAAAAGDFATWSRPEAAWCAIAVMALAEAPTTPLPGVRRALRRALGTDPAGALYAEVLPRVRRVLEDPERFTELWQPRWTSVTRDLDRLDGGMVSLEEDPAADLAIVETDEPIDDLALMARTPMSRVLTIGGGGTTLRYRYETWVEFASRPLPPRLPLGPLAERLADGEEGLDWRFDDVAAPRPRLWSCDFHGRPAPSAQEPAAIRAIVADYLGPGGT